MLLTRVSSFALVLCGWQVAIAEDAALQWKFNVGDEHHYRMTQKMDMTISMAADNEVKTSTNQVIDMTWKVEGIDDQGIATITQQVHRARMDMQAPGQQEMHLDTDSDEAPTGFGVMLAPLYTAMTSEPFKMTMTPRGEILDVEIPEAIVKALENMPGAAAMGDMFSKEGFKNMTQKSSLILPKAEDLKVDFEWTTSMDIKNPAFGTLATKNTYKYLGPKEVKEKQFEAFSFDLDMDFGDAVGGMPIEITAQDASGKILFSRTEGRLESSNLKQDMDMSIGVGDKNMTQKLIQTMKFERVEKEKLSE